MPPFVECSNDLWIGVEITIAASVDGRSIDILMQCLVDEVPVETALELGQSSRSSGCRGVGSADKIPVVLKRCRLSCPWCGCIRTG